MKYKNETNHEEKAGAHFINDDNAGFKFLTVVTIKGSVFWNVTLCSTVKVDQCFRAKHHLHLGG
jgi:hypothetical protein